MDRTGWRLIYRHAEGVGIRGGEVRAVPADNSAAPVALVAVREADALPSSIWFEEFNRLASGIEVLCRVCRRARRRGSRADTAPGSTRLTASRTGARELRIETGGRDELGVRAALDDPAFLQHEDQIGAQHGGQPVRDHDRRPAGERALERGLHRGLGIRVEVRGRFVEHHEVGRLQEQPRNGEALLLTAGETVAALADHGVEAVRKRLDSLQDLRSA